MNYHISNTVLYTIMATLLASGTCNTIIFKLQDQSVVGTDANGQDIKFNHPYFQCALMFVGEFCCLFLYFGKKYINSKSNKDIQDEESHFTLQKKTEEEDTISRQVILYLAFPALVDCIGCTFMYMALFQCSAGVYQMMRGVIVLITATLSVKFLGKKQYLHHWTSICMIVTGVVIVGAVGIQASSESDAKTTSFTGVFLLILSQLFVGM